MNCWLASFSLIAGLALAVVWAAHWEGATAFHLSYEQGHADWNFNALQPKLKRREFAEGLNRLTSILIEKDPQTLSLVGPARGVERKIKAEASEESIKIDLSLGWSTDTPVDITTSVLLDPRGAIGLSGGRAVAPRYEKSTATSEKGKPGLHLI